jgi:2-hydroxychromene-2-carboxylate isomerase
MQMSILKGVIAPHISEYLTSDQRLDKQRRKAERLRVKNNEPHKIYYFHQTDDPYSFLALQVLHRLQQDFDVHLEIMLVPPPPDWAAPERQALVDYSRRDARQIATTYGLSFSAQQQPPQRILERANRINARLIQDNKFIAHARSVDEAFWNQDDATLDQLLDELGDLPLTQVEIMLRQGAETREKMGHYLGATFYYAGEWYWGIDRLHFLTERLEQLGAGVDSEPGSPIAAPPALQLAERKSGDGKPSLHYYLSFRSPYTYIATPRVIELAHHYQVELKLRYVLPMIMRGLPVPRMKGFYIVRDVKREARRHGTAFGRIADPVGEPVEKGYAILPYAISEGKGEEYVLSFLQGAFADGIFAGSTAGLKKIVERSGLDWHVARKELANTEWREIAEQNRQEMFDCGLWGVPSFRVGEFSVWGQDRLWLVEKEIIKQLS